MQTFDPKTSDFSQNYKFLIGGILPRPIAVISTRNADGSNNLAPFSFFTAISAQPMIVAFCPMIRTSTGLKKDTVLNIEREKEFVVNFCTMPYVNEINLTSTELPYGQDEFTFAGLHALDSSLVKAKRLKESPLHFECVLRDILSYGENVGSGRLITGEVIKIHVDDSIIHDGKIDTDKFQAVGRGAGNDWFPTKDRFQLERLTKAQIQK